MKKLLIGAVVGLLALAGAAVAQIAPGAIKITSLVGSFAIDLITTGPMSAKLPVNGGTFTCAAGTATVANTNVDAGSLILMTLKTVGGTVANPFVATITAGTGFTVTCGGSDTSTYNYVIIG
ncbi:hypothetical protein SAMN05216337_1017133 [Bradyrhizobium brasilense]|uniref:K1 capsule-specific polysaccharide lyase C-terminal domain-containing protein n=1 Tax=Bradyrhizobium brasilense TaxID=1419277 RepID=A0A1G6YXN7_9BRAD|nr:hypothetical protein [Bradyrhizobium brasilense]SDD95022.1 hypothetical protein SAMN05216337_1017133 [Bradyrhizobium brasilense]